MHFPLGGTVISHTLGSSMNITVAAPRMVSASTCATLSPLPSPFTRLSIEVIVSEGRVPVCACRSSLACLLSARDRIMDPMPKPAPLKPAPKAAAPVLVAPGSHLLRALA